MELQRKWSLKTAPRITLVNNIIYILVLVIYYIFVIDDSPLSYIGNPDRSSFINALTVAIILLVIADLAICKRLRVVLDNNAIYYQTHISNHMDWSVRLSDISTVTLDLKYNSEILRIQPHNGKERRVSLEEWSVDGSTEYIQADHHPLFTLLSQRFDITINGDRERMTEHSPTVLGNMGIGLTIAVVLFFVVGFGILNIDIARTIGDGLHYVVILPVTACGFIIAIMLMRREMLIGQSQIAAALIFSGAFTFFVYTLIYKINIQFGEERQVEYVGYYTSDGIQIWDDTQGVFPSFTTPLAPRPLELHTKPAHVTLTVVEGLFGAYEIRRGELEKARARWLGHD